MLQDHTHKCDNTPIKMTAQAFANAAAQAALEQESFDDHSHPTSDQIAFDSLYEIAYSAAKSALTESHPDVPHPATIASNAADDLVCIMFFDGVNPALT